MPSWVCRTCTLENSWEDSAKCLACERPRPYQLPSDIKKKSASSSTPDSGNIKYPAKKKAKLRQAEESDGMVALLCHACRHDTSRVRQSSLSSFFSTAPAIPVPPNHCSRCRKPLTKASKGGGGYSTSMTGALPHIERLKSYKRLAKDGLVPFELTDSQATEIMRRNCSMCGAASDPEKGHGITRLRIWPNRLLQARADCLKPYMGPFVLENVMAACSTCNQMKGARRISSLVRACRHIATKQGLGEYGLYPTCFRNNISKRSRSSYITASSTHTKTHALTNEEFNQITTMPCHYCGKESSPKSDPPHHNGLDRLDSDNRVYDVNTVVSCCGDCNLMKYIHTKEKFLMHVAKVAKHNVGNLSIEDEDDGEGAEAHIDEEEEL